MNPGSDPNGNSNMTINSTRDAMSPIPTGTGPKIGATGNEGDGDLNVTWPVESSHYKILGKVGRGAFATVYKALATTTTKITASSTITAASDKAADASTTTTTTNNDTAAASTVTAAATNTNINTNAITTKLTSSLCAIKIINLEHVDTNFVDIRCEVQTMRLSSHPNILACLTSFIHHTNLWLVMQLMDKGSSLHCLQTARSLYNPLNQVHAQELAEAQKLKKQHQQQQDAEISHQKQVEESGSVNVNANVNVNVKDPSKIQIQPPKIINMERHITYILHETILGLQYIHDNGQIHRDIKAGNILLDSHGNVRIADFGVSGWLVNEGSQRESARTFVGTPCWMAPEVMEQVTGYDTKADIWSLGITALELYKGYAPYAKYPPMKVLILTIQEDPPGFDTYVDEEEDDFMTGMTNTGGRGGDYSSENVNVRILEEYSASFRSMVTWCLQKDPRNRPNCEELLNHEHFAPLRDEALRAEYKQRMKEEICNQIDNVGGQDISNTGSGGGGNNPSNAMPKSSDNAGGGGGGAAAPNTIEATQDSEQDDINDPTVGVRNHNGSSTLDLSITIEGEESRPKGTTWIFTDGSQVAEPSRRSRIDANANGEDHGALGNTNNGGDKADDKDAFFDQFEQATQGEDFKHPSVLTEEERRKGKLCANNDNIESGKNEELDSDSDKDAINAFMDQFEEQTSQRELH